MSETNTFEEKIIMTIMKDIELLSEVIDAKQMRKESNLLIKRIESSIKLMGETSELNHLLKVAKSLKV